MRAERIVIGVAFALSDCNWQPSNTMPQCFTGQRRYIIWCPLVQQVTPHLWLRKSCREHSFARPQSTRTISRPQLVPTDRQRTSPVSRRKNRFVGPVLWRGSMMPGAYLVKPVRKLAVVLSARARTRAGNTIDLSLAHNARLCANSMRSPVAEALRDARQNWPHEVAVPNVSNLRAA